MATNGEIGPEVTEMVEHDDEKVVTMMDVLKEQEDFEEDANAVLGASDDKNCTYPMGYIKRQAIYACMTCCTDAKYDSSKRAGICLACSLKCHEDHELIELYTKRNFRCDCGNPKFNSNPCQFVPNKTDLNDDNNYNQNFSGLYCVCHRPYPDPEVTEEDEMIQCIICEDWLHSAHLDATLPDNDQYSEMICKSCMQRNEFLHNYSDLVVNTENDFVNVDISMNRLSNDDQDQVNILETLGEKAEYEKIKEKSCQDDMKEKQNDSHVLMDTDRGNENSGTTKNIADLVSSIENTETTMQNNMSVDKDLLGKECDNNLIKNEVSTKVTEDEFNVEQKNNQVTSSNTSLEAKVCDNEDHTIVNENSSKMDNMEVNAETPVIDINNKEDSNKNKESDNTNVLTSTISDEFVKCIEQGDSTQLLNSSSVESAGEQITNNETSTKIHTEPLNEEDNVEISNETKTVNTLNEQIATNDEACDGTKKAEHINEKSQSIDLLENNAVNEATDQNKPTKSSTESKTTEPCNEESKVDLIIEKSAVVSSAEELEKMEEDKLLEDPDDVSQKAANDNVEKDTEEYSKPDETDNKNLITGDTKPSDIDNEPTVKEGNDMEVPNHNSHSNTEATVPINCEEHLTCAVIDNSNYYKEITVNSDKEHSIVPVADSEKLDIKRKLSIEESQIEIDTKKLKLDSKPCVKPKITKQKYKGATFWPAHFRQKLCTCNECLSIYKDLSVLFLIDPEDTVSAYEHLGKEKTNGKPSSEYEKGLAALSSLDRIQQINALTEYNKMRDKLLDFLKSFKDRKEVVKEEDIKAFFAGMKPKREPDGVYFCR